MRIEGFIGADLEGGTEHEEGGIGPFLKERVREEAHAAPYVLERLARALRALKIDDVTGLWIGDVAIVELAPDEAVGVDEAISSATSSSGHEQNAGLQLSLSHEDGQLLHIMTVSYKPAHDPEEAALEILDSAHVLALEPLEDETPEAYEERLASVLEPHQTLDDFATPYVDLERSFIQRLHDAVARELSLVEPETTVEVDHEGMNTLDDLHAQTLATSSAFPGLDLQ